jgi:hypothetical protein
LSVGQEKIHTLTHLNKILFQGNIKILLLDVNVLQFITLKTKQTEKKQVVNYDNCLEDTSVVYNKQAIKARDEILIFQHCFHNEESELEPLIDKIQLFHNEFHH